jgi:nicotinamide-nucleotide amidase
MRAAILSVGSELMQGFLTDTNATYLTQELSALGIETTGVFQVGDELDRVILTFQRALEDAELVVATGGIGPTADDLTREAVAAVRGEHVSIDPSLVETIRRFFALRGLSMPDQNVKQAWLIPSAESLDNPMGTAPGWFVRHHDRMIVLMPGVPREMRRMWHEQAVPRILPRLEGSRIVSRTLKTIGIGESAAEVAIADIIARGYPIVATYAKNDGVHIRVTAVADTSEIANDAVNETDQQIRAAIGAHVYGYLEDSLPSAIVSPLLQSGQQVAIWEAGSAARLGNLLLDDDIAAPAVALARVTSFGDACASFGASPNPTEVACACAQAAARESGTAFGASIAVLIENGDHPDRARGKIGLALHHSGGTVTREHVVTAIAPEIRRRATLWSSDFFWTAIRDAVDARRD